VSTDRWQQLRDAMAAAMERDDWLETVRLAIEILLWEAAEIAPSAERRQEPARDIRSDGPEPHHHGAEPSR
jgi:hypothetical protein